MAASAALLPAASAPRRATAAAACRLPAALSWPPTVSRRYSTPPKHGSCTRRTTEGLGEMF